MLIASEVFYCLTMIVLKIALALFFLRVMIEPWQKRVVYCAVTLSTLAGAAYLFFSVFFCGLPVTAALYWERRLAGQCASKNTLLGMSFMHAAITAGTDLLLALLAIPMTLRANIGKKEKVDRRRDLHAGHGVSAQCACACRPSLNVDRGIAASLTRIHWIPHIAETGEDFWGERAAVARDSD